MKTSSDTISSIINCRVAAGTTATTVETIQPLTEVVEGITGDVIPVNKPCEKCGLYPHPVSAIKDLPPELQAEFPVLNRHNVDTMIGISMYNLIESQGEFNVAVPFGLRLVL